MNTIYNDVDEIESVYITNGDKNFSIYLINAIDDIDEHPFYSVSDHEDFFIIKKSNGADMIVIHYNNIETVSLTDEHMMFTLKNNTSISISFYKSQFIIL